VNIRSDAGAGRYHPGKFYKDGLNFIQAFSKLSRFGKDINIANITGVLPLDYEPLYMV